MGEQSSLAYTSGTMRQLMGIAFAIAAAMLATKAVGSSVLPVLASHCSCIRLTESSSVFQANIFTSSAE